MASKDLLDLKLLEEDLISAIAQDKLYQVRNAAKLRAACDQKVSSYDEFRQVFVIFLDRVLFYCSC